jgi:hypothetical protein
MVVEMSPVVLDKDGHVITKVPNYASGLIMINEKTADRKSLYTYRAPTVPKAHVY